MPEHESRSSKIAIPFGKPGEAASPHGIKQRARPAHTKRHRAHALHNDSESEGHSDTDQQSYGRQENITSLDLLGRSSGQDKDRRRGESSTSEARPAQAEQKEDAPAQRDGDGTAENSESQDKPVKWGLTINMKGAKRTKDHKARTDSPESEEAATKKGTKSIDEEALDALMGSRTPKRKQTDSDATDRDPQPEDYRAVPIDDFGATLLRGFGWDGKMRGKVIKATRHANLTGLGSKDAKGAEDLGAWNQKTAKDSRPVRLDDYRREESKKRQRTDDRYADSYKREREREREQERGHGRDR